MPVEARKAALQSYSAPAEVGLKLNLQPLASLRVGRSPPICSSPPAVRFSEIFWARVPRKGTETAYGGACAENRAACRSSIEADSCHSGPTRFPATHAQRGRPATLPSKLVDGHHTSTHNLIRP